MRTRIVLACIPVSVAMALTLGACGDDDSATSAPTTAAAVTTAPATTAPATTTPIVTAATVTTTAPAPTTTADDGIIDIDVTVGVDSGPQRIETVPLGSTVRITLTDPAAPQEYHVHGYDLGDGQTFAAGQAASFTFTADEAGEFEIESHLTDDLLVVLKVV